MRKLGSQLGVEAMSLYNHVRNKADLLDAMHGQLLGQMSEQLAQQVPVRGWQAAAGNLCRAFVGLLKDHPQAIPLFASRSAIAPDSLAFLDDSIGVLLAAGFGPKESLQVFQTLFAFSLGHAIFHYGSRSQDSYVPPERYLGFAHLQQLGDPRALSPEEEFEFGLQALLRGLDRQEEEPARTAHSSPYEEKTPPGHSR